MVTLSSTLESLMEETGKKHSVSEQLRMRRVHSPGHTNGRDTAQMGATESDRNWETESNDSGLGNTNALDVTEWSDVFQSLV